MKLDLLSDLIKDLEKEVDDIEWEDARDPRIEGLLQQLNYYKEKYKQGELYEPRF
jgi:hypothetical protein